MTTSLRLALALASLGALGAFTATAGGCLKSTTFTCDVDDDCGTGGVCETAAGGFCSFADSSCTVSGRRFGDNSGPSSGLCVGETPGGDGGVDSSIDGAPDAPPMGCPGDYVTLPNSGPRGHRYKLRANMASWTSHRDACSAEGTFLAFPDGANAVDAGAELSALTTLAGAGAWVGINDQLMEGSYRTSLNMPVSAVTMQLISTGGGNPNGQDCLVSATTSMTDEACNDNRAAVCECVP